MYYGRKKWITIAIVAVVVVILAVVATVVILNTDLFKSDKILFWKYIGQNLNNKQLQNAQLEDIEKMKEQSPYTITGELLASSTDEELNNTLGKTILSIEGQTDKVNDYSHTNAKVQYADATIFNLDYTKSDDIYALKSDEIVTVYLGIRNENLKVLFQKLGLEDTSAIPDTITPVNLLELFKFSDEEIQHINETYTNIIVNSISEDSYSKQTEAVIEKDGVSYNTTSYRLDLTAVQISEIFVNVLNALKTDSITLNMLSTKLRTAGISEEYTTIEEINNMIDDIISEVQQTEFTDTSFVVYSYKGEKIATEILIRNEQKITIYNGETNTKIIAEDLTGSAQYKVLSIDLTYQTASTQSNINIKISADNEDLLLLNLNNTGSAAHGILQTSCSITTYSNEGETLDLLYNQTLEFVSELEDMEKLDETNCAILNDYSQEQLASLTQAIINQIVTVYNQKAQMLGIAQTQDQIVQ